MAKIMQVINKKSNFQNGTVDLQLYQTGFASLTKLIDTVPGQTVENAANGQYVGFEFFHDLNNKQLVVRDYVDRYKNVYNVEIDKKIGKVTNLIKFEYNWKSCVDYKSQIRSGDRADYRLLTKIVAAEKELYDYRVYSQQHIKKNCQIMGEWSKTQNYFSNFVSLEFHWGGPKQWPVDKVEFRTQGYVASLPRHFINPSNEYTIVSKDVLEKIPVGGSATVSGLNLTPGAPIVIQFEIRVYQIENDKYFTHRVTIMDRYLVNNAWTTYVRTGNPSPHFTDTSGKYNLNFFKTRVLI